MGKTNTKIKFITDSGCDIPLGVENQHNIDVMSFEVSLDDIIYRERIDVTPKEFYSLLNNSNSMPTTSQITVPRFEEKFKQCVDEGIDDVIVITINSKGSQTFFNALKARDNLIEENKTGKTTFHIIDSRSYSIVYGLALIEASKKAQAGQSVERIISYLEDWFACAEVYILPLNLAFLKKSGRVTAAAAFLGELMGLRPVISLIDGNSEVVKKVRGENALLDEAVKVARERMTPETPWISARADAEEFYQKMTARLSRELGKPPVITTHLGCVVAANTGPNSAAFIIKGENRGAMKY